MSSRGYMSIKFQRQIRSRARCLVSRLIHLAVVLYRWWTGYHVQLVGMMSKFTPEATAYANLFAIYYVCSSIISGFKAVRLACARCYRLSRPICPNKITTRDCSAKVAGVGEIHLTISWKRISSGDVIESNAASGEWPSGSTFRSSQSQSEPHRTEPLILSAFPWTAEGLISERTHSDEKEERRTEESFRV